MSAPTAFDRHLARLLEHESVEHLARRLGTGTEYIRIRVEHVRAWDERERQRAGFDGALPFPPREATACPPPTTTLRSMDPTPQ